MVSEPGSTKDTTKVAGPLRRDQAPCVGPFAEKAATTIQASNSFRLKGGHDELMESHLRGNVVCKCELYVPHQI